MSLHAGDGLTVMDAMCGGGGSSLGIRNFFERAEIPIKRFVAINHDPGAIMTHEWNHPGVIHYCQDVSHVDLREAFPEGRCDFAWASPSCTQHSPARGGRAINDQLRNGPWQLLTIATEVHVERWAIENVPAFVDWSPLNDAGRPIKSRRGEIFRAWKAAFEAIGYTFEYRISDAAWWGAATTRPRFLALLTKKGKIYWAVPTHGDAAGDLFTGHRQPLVGVGKHLDLSLPSNPVTARKVPLAPPTLARSWEGMVRLYPASARRVYAPDVRDACYEGLEYCRKQLLKAESDLARKPRKGTRGNSAKRRAEIRERIARLTKRIDRYNALLDDVLGFLESPITPSSGSAQPFLVTLRGTERGHITSSATSIDSPARVVVAGGSHLALATPGVEPFVGGNRAHNLARPGSAPAGGVTTATGGGLFAVTPCLEALILGQHGGGIARPQSKPTSTIATDGAHSIVIPRAEPCVVATTHGGRLYPTSRPAPSPTTRNGIGVAQPHVEPLGETLGEVVVQPFLVANFGERPGQRPRVHAVEEPAPTVTPRGAGDLVHGTVAPLSPELAAAIEVLPEGVKERLLIGEDGNLYIARLFFRMLHPQKELAPIMGFPRDYRWPASPVKTTKLIGNAVHPFWAEAHTEAFLGPVFAPEYIRKRFGDSSEEAA